MTGTLRYWIEQSEHECGKPLPIGSCFKCDMLQLERERDDAIEMMRRTRDNSGKIIASQAAENIILTQQRDRLANVLQNIRSGYGGQIPDPDCGCDDCAYLRPIDEALQSLKQTKKYDAKDHASFYP